MRVVLSTWYPIGNLTEPFNLSDAKFKSRFEWICRSCFICCQLRSLSRISCSIGISPHSNAQTLRRDYKTMSSPSACDLAYFSPGRLLKLPDNHIFAPLSAFAKWLFLRSINIPFTQTSLLPPLILSEWDGVFLASVDSNIWFSREKISWMLQRPHHSGVSLRSTSDYRRSVFPFHFSS